MEIDFEEEKHLPASFPIEIEYCAALLYPE